MTSMGHILINWPHNGEKSRKTIKKYRNKTSVLLYFFMIFNANGMNLTFYEMLACVFWCSKWLPKWHIANFIYLLYIHRLKWQASIYPRTVWSMGKLLHFLRVSVSPNVFTVSIQCEEMTIIIIISLGFLEGNLNIILRCNIKTEAIITPNDRFWATGLFKSSCRQENT